MGWTFYSSSGQKLSSKGKVPVSDLADGTDGELITWDTSGVATTVAAGTIRHVLMSGGAGSVPSFQAALKSTIVAFTHTAAEGTSDEVITGACFTPTAVIMLGGKNVSQISEIGFGDDANVDYNLGWSNAGTSHVTGVFAYGDVASGNEMVAVLTSLDTDGCTIAFTKTNSGYLFTGAVMFLG